MRCLQQAKCLDETTRSFAVDFHVTTHQHSCSRDPQNMIYCCVRFSEILTSMFTTKHFAEPNDDFLSFVNIQRTSQILCIYLLCRTQTSQVQISSTTTILSSATNEQLAASCDLFGEIMKRFGVNRTLRYHKHTGECQLLTYKSKEKDVQALKFPFLLVS